MQKEKIKIAKELIKMGMEAEKISKVTELSVEQIESIK